MCASEFPSLWRNWLLGKNEMLGKLGGVVAPLTNIMMAMPPVRLLMEATLGIDRHAPFPKFHFTTFRRWFYVSHRRQRDAVPVGKRQVIYFHGCATNHYEPEVGKAIVVLKPNATATEEELLMLPALS